MHAGQGDESSRRRDLRNPLSAPRFDSRGLSLPQVRCWSYKSAEQWQKANRNLRLAKKHRCPAPDGDSSPSLVEASRRAWVRPTWVCSRFTTPWCAGSDSGRFRFGRSRRSMPCPSANGNWFNLTRRTRTERPRFKRRSSYGNPRTAPMRCAYFRRAVRTKDVASPGGPSASSLSARVTAARSTPKENGPLGRPTPRLTTLTFASRTGNCWCALRVRTPERAGTAPPAPTPRAYFDGRPRFC